MDWLGLIRCVDWFVLLGLVCCCLALRCCIVLSVAWIGLLSYRFVYVLVLCKRFFCDGCSWILACVALIECVRGLCWCAVELSSGFV